MFLQLAWPGRSRATDTSRCDRVASISSSLWRRRGDGPRRAARVRPGAHVAEGFGGDNHFFALDPQVLERLTGNALRFAARIGVGGVEEVDARLKRAGEQRVGFVLPGCADFLILRVAAESHGAKAQFRYEEASASEFVVTHTVFLERTLSSTGTP